MLCVHVLWVSYFTTLGDGGGLRFLNVTLPGDLLIVFFVIRFQERPYIRASLINSVIFCRFVILITSFCFIVICFL